MQLRYYQREACDAVFDYWRNGGGNPLIDLATGTGKSLVLATLCKELIEAYPSVRILMLTHVRELVSQNAQALLRAWSQAPLGINSAGLGRRDRHSQILYASVQSVAKDDAYSIGERHVVIVDEAHLIPKSGAGQYLQLIGRLRERTPDLRVVGLTATPYRLGTGRLDRGEGAIFNKVVYQYGIAKGVDDGFLSPLISRATGQIIDVSKVGKSGGEFKADALEQACNVDKITQAACDEIIERGKGRRAWLAFCSGVLHSQAVRDALLARGISCGTVSGETPKGEREAIFRAFKDGRLQALTGCQVFTTGFDAPRVDLIAMLRPTLSTSLYVQMLGRGTRIAEGKKDCLVLDFAGNVRRHGPVDAVTIRGAKEAGSVAEDSVRAKECPDCETLVAVAATECPNCGHEWPRDITPKHDRTADKESAVMSREIVDRWLTVSYVSAHVHAKDGKQSMRVEYLCGKSIYREWVTLDHIGYAKAKAQKWWRSVVSDNAPLSVKDGVSRFRDEAHIAAIQIERDGKYWRVCAWRVYGAQGRLMEVDRDLKARHAALQLMEAAE